MTLNPLNSSQLPPHTGFGGLRVATYNIHKGVLSNPASLARQARVMPSLKDGETRGFKFYGIKPGSLPKLLNIKNGDLITSVNGTDLKSMDGAMSLYAKLRRANNLSVTIERKGETITKEITIQ